MTLIRIPGPEAVQTRKSNPFAGWGTRGEENRVEPVAKPDFDVPFTLEPGQKVFTIGSCFARNVETELQRRGFKVPMRDLFRTPAFEGLDLGLVNNFGTPSIYNEFAWAFGEERFDESTGFAQLYDDKWTDLHLVHSIRPSPLEDVRRRRRALTDAIRSLAECRVLIMTLGLVELWWDGRAGNYLNTAPMPSVMAASPGRFELHVLDFKTCCEYLEKAIAIALKHGRDDLNIILTVSPVPLMTTHRPQDVMVANSYSKSLLRAVAEQVVLDNEQVGYFPSYESVTLSDRRLAWLEDMTHVTREMVELNVQRMVNAYSGGSEAERSLPGEDELTPEDPAMLLIVEKAKIAREKGDEDFFEQNSEISQKSESFAIEHARFLFSRGQAREARAVVRHWDGKETLILRGEIELKLKEYDGAIATIAPLCRSDVKGNAPWKILMAAHEGNSNVAGVLEAAKGWIAAYPRFPHRAQWYTVTTLCRMKQYESALEHMHPLAAHYDGTAPGVALRYAKLLLRFGKSVEAKQALANVAPKTEHQKRAVENIRSRIEDKLKDAA